MVQIISGQKGKGKTKFLLDKVNASVNEAHGSIVYLDKSAKHMYELSNRVRLINVSEYPITSFDGFLGLICGIISQDHDLEQMYFDSFLKIAHVEGKRLTDSILQIDDISKKFGVDFILSISTDKDDLEDEIKPYVIISL